jgi:hypothetical protein
MSVFQTLLAGNTAQVVPGTGAAATGLGRVPSNAPAVSATATAIASRRLFRIHV